MTRPNRATCFEIAFRIFEYQKQIRNGTFACLLSNRNAIALRGGVPECSSEASRYRSCSSADLLISTGVAARSGVHAQLGRVDCFRRDRLCTVEYKSSELLKA